jgi:hypothetical protein
MAEHMNKIKRGKEGNIFRFERAKEPPPYLFPYSVFLLNLLISVDINSILKDKKNNKGNSDFLLQKFLFFNQGQPSKISAQMIKLSNNNKLLADY